MTEQKKIENSEFKLDDSVIQNQEANEVRTAQAKDVKSALDSNPNKHDGSAGGNDLESIQIVALDGSGLQKIIAERPKKTIEQKVAPRAEVGQHSKDVSPSIKAQVEKLQAIRQQIDQAGLENGGIHSAITPERAKALLEGHIEKEQLTDYPDWLSVTQKIADLPLDKQLEVIGAGLMAGLEQYSSDERQRTWGRIIGTTEGIGNVAVNIATIAEFICDVIAGNKKRASARGEEFGKAIGETIVGGIKLFEAADQYLFNIGFTGDYSKPFVDLANFGQALNNKWRSLSPLEQERIKSRFITEMATDSLIGAGGAKAISKAKVFTEVLDAVALESKAARCAVKGIGKQVAVDIKGMSQDVRHAGQNVVQYINDLLRDFQTAELAIPGGGQIKIRRDFGRPQEKPITHLQMSAHGKSGSSGPFEENIVNPIDRNADQTVKAAQLLALTEENEPLVEELLKIVDTSLDTTSKISNKTANDIIDKANRPSIKEKKPWFDVEHIRDSFRFKTPVENLSALPKIVEYLKNSNFEILNLDLDKLLRPKGRGWRMAAIDIKAPNGQILEYQILAKEMNEAGDLEHQMYKEWRGKDVKKMTPEMANAKSEVDTWAADLYSDAWNDYLKRTGQTTEDIECIIKRTREIEAE